MKYHIVFDNSGSMAEYGKPFLLANLLRYIRQVISQNSLDSQLYSASEQIIEIDWSDNEKDIELPVIGKSLTTENLITFLNKKTTEKVLLLTDGYLEMTSTQVHNLQQYSNLIIVALGGDAHCKNLTRIKGFLFVASEISSALEVLFLPSLKRQPLLSSVQLKVSDTNAIETDDDW